MSRFQAICHDCDWTSAERTDVIVADDAGGEHAADETHLTEVVEVA